MPRDTAAVVAPALDDTLRKIARGPSGAMASVDFYASARLEADWDEVEDIGPDEDPSLASSVDVMLLFDGKWQAKLTERPSV